MCSIVYCTLLLTTPAHLIIEFEMWKKPNSTKQTSSKHKARDASNKRKFYSFHEYDDDNEEEEEEENFLVGSTSTVPEVIRVRREFQIGGARGKSLLLRSCRGNVETDDANSSLMAAAILSDQQGTVLNLEHSANRQYRGLGYKDDTEASLASMYLRKRPTDYDHHESDNEAVEEEYHQEVMESSSSEDDKHNQYSNQKFNSKVCDWAQTSHSSKDKLILGIFVKKEDDQQPQQYVRYPGPTVPDNFIPKHIFSKEEEMQLDTQLASLLCSNVSSAKDSHNAAIKNTASTSPSIISSRDKFSPIPIPIHPNDLETKKNKALPTDVANNFALALNQRFSTTDSTTQQKEVQHHESTPETKQCTWKRHSTTFIPTPLLCKRFLLPKTLIKQSAIATPKTSNLLSSEHQLSELLSLSIPSSSFDVENTSNSMFHNDAATTVPINRPPINLLKTIFEPTLTTSTDEWSTFPDRNIQVKQENDIGSSPKEQPIRSYAIDRNTVCTVEPKEPPKQRSDESVEHVSSRSIVKDPANMHKIRHSGSSSSSCSSSTYYRKRKRKKRERKEKDYRKKHKHSKSSKKKKKRSRA